MSNDFMSVDGLDDDNSSKKAPLTESKTRGQVKGKASNTRPNTPPPAPKKKATKQAEIEQEAAGEVLEPSVGDGIYNILDMPCKGRLGYPATITHRDILWKDEKILSGATEDTYIRTINRVVKGILDNPDYYEDISIFSRDYILVWLYVNNFESIRELTSTCECGQEDTVKVDLTELPVTPLNEGYQEPFPITLRNGNEVNLRVFRVRDEIYAEQYISEHEDSEEDLLDLMLISSIDIGGDKELSLEEKVKWAEENLTSRDMAMIRRFHDYYHFGIDETIKHNCSACSKEVTGRLPFRPDEFIQPPISDDIDDLLFSGKGVEDPTE